MVDQSRAELVQSFVSHLPYCRALGMQIDEISEGVARMSLPYREDLVGDPATGVLHGGSVSALMDTVSAAAVMSHPDSGVGNATLDLRIDYMRGSAPGLAIRARAECTHVARSVAFVRATAWDDDPDRPIATAAGAFTIMQPEDRE